MIVATAFSGWSDDDLRRSLEVTEEIVFKATALGAYQRLAAKELRLRNTLATVHVRIARKADKALLTALKNVKGEITQATINRLVDRWAKAFKGYTADVIDDVRDVIAFAQHAGQKVTLQRVFGAPKETIVYQGPPFKGRTPIETEVVVEKATLEILPSTQLADLRAIEQITKGQAFWIGKYHSTILDQQIRQVTSDIILKQGLPSREAGIKLGEALGYVNGYIPVKPKVTIPKGWSGSTLQYFDGVAANAATLSRIHGQMSAMIELGFDRYEVVNGLDERTCVRCEAINGDTLDVRKSFQQMVEVIGGPPGAIPAGHPWLSESDFMSKYKSSGAAGIQGLGAGYPPFHFKCRCTIDIVPDSAFTTVPIPSTVTTPVGATPKLPKTSKAPTHDPSKMAKAMTNKPTVANQAIVREELNLMLAEEGGVTSTDVALARKEAGRLVLKADSRMPGANAYWHPETGEITVRRSVWEKAQRFAKKIAAGETVTTAEANGFRTLVHESYHGASMMKWEVYKGVGMMLEEVATESAARRLMVRRFGQKWNDFFSYADWMNKTETTIRRAWRRAATKAKIEGISELTSSEAQKLMGRVGIDMKKVAKKKTTQGLDRKPDGALRRYVKHSKKNAEDFLIDLSGANVESTQVEAFSKKFARELKKELLTQ